MLELPIEELIKNEVYSNPSISFDGSLLAYIKCEDDFKLIVRNLKTEEETIIYRSDNYIGKYFWTYDNSIVLFQDNNGDEKHRLIYLNLLENEVEAIKMLDKVINVEILNYSINDVSKIFVALTFEDREFSDIYVVNLKGKEIKLFKENPGYISDWYITDNGNLQCGYISRSDGGIDLVLLHEKNSYKILASWNVDEIFSSDFIFFSKDEKFIYIKDSSQKDTSSIVKINLEDCSKEYIFNDEIYDIDKVIIDTYNKDIEGVSVYGSKRIWKAINKDIEEDLNFLYSLNWGDVNICSRNKDNTLWVVSFNKDTTGIVYYIFDRVDKKLNLLFYANPKLIDYELMPMEPIEFVARDGIKIRGYVTIPKNKDGELPLVVNVHGGPQSRDYFGYNKDVQWFATRGYGVLQINYRGSVSFGKSFLRKGYKEWGGKMQNDIIDGVKFAVDNYNIDPSRICIYGGSYGGYAALAGATFNSDIFKCAISINGPSSLVTFLDNMPPFWKKYKECFYERVGHPIKDKDMLIERSPLYNLHKIRCPIFIAQGERDPRVNKQESESLINELKAKKIKYEYLSFSNEGHSIRKNENKIELYNRMAMFLEENL